MCLVSPLTARMWVRTEIRVTSAGVRNMGIELGRAEVRVTEHLLHAAEIGTSFEEVRGEGVAQEVRVHAGGVEPRLGGQAAEDEERSRPGERASLGVEEELGPMPAVEEGAASRQVSPHRLDSLAPERDDALLVPLAQAAYEPVLEIDATAVEPDGLAHA